MNIAKKELSNNSIAKEYAVIKKLAIITSIMTISVLLNGMENVFPLKSLNRTKTAEQGSQSRRQEVAEVKPDLRLNLDTIPDPLLSAANGKPSIKNLQHVSHLKSKQDTYRESVTGRDSSDARRNRYKNNGRVSSKLRQPLLAHNSIRVKNNDDQEEDVLEVQNSDGLRNHNAVPIENLIESLSQDNSFSPEDMWSLLKKANPKLYDHAITNQLSLDEVLDCPYDFDAINPQIQGLLNQLAKKKQLPLAQMMEYVHLLDNFNIEPEALGQLLQNQHGFSDSHTHVLISKFKGIQKNNADQYLSLALDFITRTCDDGGLKDPSPIHSTHVAIQNDTIAEEKKQKLYSMIANVITIVGIVATAAWAIYGQVTGTTNPTGAPTEAPTNAPTNMPTYAPTLPPV